MTLILYQEEAHNRTPAQVAHGFAGAYWDKPRQVENLRQDKQGHTLFNVADGSRLYEVVYIPAVPFTNPAIYQVVVVGE
jgi:hypothetical protein